MPIDLRAVRAELPCLEREVYLNTGWAGPLPRRVAAALARWGEEALGHGRGAPIAAERLTAAEAAVREAAGRAVAAPAGEIALAGNTSLGVATVVAGIDWRPGDEAITTALEHPGLTAPLAAVARRAGARLRVIAPDDATSGLAAAVAALAGPRTRLVALSHVSWSTGALLDVAGAARAARAAGALSLVDGAQAVGVIPVDARALGADAYAFPAHKWLLGPEGLGALWVAPGALERIGLSAAGTASGAGFAPDGTFRPHPGARRYEASTPPAALLGGWLASLAWLEELGWGWVHSRVREGQAAARAALGALPGVEVLTPPGPQGGLVTFRLPGRAPAEVCRELAERGVIVRWLPAPAAVRASIGFFNDEADIAALTRAVGAVSGC